MKYVGLTDDTDRRWLEHGRPGDWWQTNFDSESVARAWEKIMLNKPGYQGGTGGAGWQYGYIYTITMTTIE